MSLGLTLVEGGVFGAGLHCPFLGQLPGLET